MRNVVLFGLLVALAGCAKASKDKSGRLAINERLDCPPTSFHAGNDDVPRLRPAESCPKFAGYLIAALTQQAVYGGVRGGFFDGGVGAVLEGDAVATADDSGGPANFNKTNVQEAGVDEADFVKTDGKHIYLLHGNKLRILKSWPPTEMTVVSSLAIAGYPTAMLLYEGRLAILAAGGGVAVDSIAGDVLAGDSVAEEAAPEFPTQLTIVNVADPKAPVVERTVGMEMSVIDARLVNGRILVAGNTVLSTNPLAGVVYRDQPVTEADRPAVARTIAQAVTQTTYGDWLPEMLDSARGERELMVDSFDALYVPTVTGSVGATAIVSLDLGHEGAALNKVVLASEGAMLYANADALYLMYSDRWWWWGGGEPGLRTYLHRMRLNEEAVPHYTGSVTVPGWIDSPFWVSEHAEALRVVSGIAGRNFLHTFDVAGDGDPASLAAIAGFGKDEAITGVRFIGPRAYVSTALMRTVNIFNDPFFTFDLADPAAPKLRGALEMPGYTAYIHPLDDDHVLAVGMFAASMADPVTAVQVQVFDVSDFAHPVTAAQHVFTVGVDGAAFSDALNDHHAFTFYEPKGIFTLPLQAFDGSWATAFNGLAAMHVGADASLTELGRVDHYAFNAGNYWASNVRRSVVMQGDDGEVFLYSISDKGVIVSKVDDALTTIGSVELPLADLP